MNRLEYENACLAQLTDHRYYEEVPQNPTLDYAKKVSEMAKELRSLNFITDRQQHSLTSECRTPAPYGLPKMHKDYGLFPAFRLICSGTNSPTAKLSQFIDTILKPAAQRTASYVKDTTDFILKIKDTQITAEANTPTYLVTMDVTSLYPNIDHHEGTQACINQLQNTANGNNIMPSDLIKRLFLLILQSNTMEFLGKFYHQIKGTAMGTGMAVNYANLFMAEFEDKMLQSYFNLHGTRPKRWLRFIDDIFFLWEGDEASLKQFLRYCNDFSEQQNMASSIKFTHSYSVNSVTFLDTTIILPPPQWQSHHGTLHQANSFLPIPPSKFVS